MIHTTMALLNRLGLLINKDKSTLHPVQDIEFIGARLDSVTARAYLPRQRFATIQEIITGMLTMPTTTVLTCLRLMGHMPSTTYIVHHARLHFRCFQLWVATVYIPSRHPRSKRITIPPNVLASLPCWTMPNNLLAGVPFQQTEPTIQITTDASLLGWGAHMDSCEIQGKWSPNETLLNINILEIRAVKNACAHFASDIANHTVRILTDDICTMFYLNRQGGARSLCAEAIRLWNSCIRNQVTLIASYLPGVNNTREDSLS
nr:uncharacterized protein LOC106732754 [Pelodiscus sinensis]|eukprot:XP_014434568.1 uncharacterized protein LOC106732754 [Pelodiscus sinensis]